MQPEQINDSTPAYAAPAQSENVPEVDSKDYVEAEPIRWQAPEYLQERRSPWWFIGFWVIAVVLMAIAAFVIRSWSFAILVPAMAAALMIYSHRPPRMLDYALSPKGIYINDKLHPLVEFRSFGVLRDESIPSLMLIPTKRFRPGLTVHFPVEVGESVVDFLGQRIPMQELKLDMFDRIIRKLHI